MPIRQLGRLGNLVALRSAYQFAEGDEDGAIEGLIRFLALGRRFQRTGEMLHYLLGSACEMRAPEQILHLSSYSAGDNLDDVGRRVTEYAWERDAMEKTLKREYSASPRN